MTIKTILNPKVIAVIGASENSNKVGGVLMDKLKKFKGKIIPVNINRKTINREKCYSSIIHYPKKVDLAIIAVPKTFVKKVLLDCVYRKIKNVIIISAGFSEIGDTESQEELVKIAKDNGIVLLGPNCFGVANPTKNLDLTFSNESPRKGTTAFVSQSGALGSYIMDKIPLSAFVSLGNMSDLSFDEFIRYFSKDKNTEKIVCYIEKLKDGRKFIDACLKCKKEIIVIKAGSSIAGKEATLSHTGSLATDYNIYSGAFRQAGVTQANSIEEAFGIKTTKLNYKEIKNPTIITNAGGAGALLTDALENNGVKLNKQPIDILGTASTEEYRKAINKTSIKNKIMVVLTPQRMSNPIEVAKMISTHKKKAQVICYFLGGKSVKKAINILKKAEVEVRGSIL